MDPVGRRVARLPLRPAAIERPCDGHGRPFRTGGRDHPRHGPRVTPVSQGRRGRPWAPGWRPHGHGRSASELGDARPRCRTRAAPRGDPARDPRRRLPTGRDAVARERAGRAHGLGLAILHRGLAPVLRDRGAAASGRQGLDRGPRGLLGRGARAARGLGRRDVPRWLGMARASPACAISDPIKARASSGARWRAAVPRPPRGRRARRTETEGA